MTALGTMFLALALLSYFSGTLSYAGGLATKSRVLAGWGRVFLVAGALVHFFALIAHTATIDRPPVLSSLENLAFYGLVVVVCYLVFEWRMQTVAIGALIAPLAFVALAVVALAPQQSELGLLDLWSAWVAVHISTSIIGYAVFTLACGAAALYLFQDYLLRAKCPFVLSSLLPSLTTTERLGYQLVALAFPFLTVTIVTGVVWSAHEWGTAWHWEPKQVMTLITWLIFATYLGGHASRHLRGRRAAWLVIAGFAALLVTFFGANLILPGGLHDF